MCSPQIVGNGISSIKVAYGTATEVNCISGSSGRGRADHAVHMGKATKCGTRCPTVDGHGIPRSCHGPRVYALGISTKYLDSTATYKSSPNCHGIAVGFYSKFGCNSVKIPTIYSGIDNTTIDIDCISIGINILGMTCYVICPTDTYGTI
ncbi:hypothetical protein DSM101010T_16160 [Desulfovibrio subterraneus]|uniref:Uncharacterized protein n=1 Tax=Desulfovibrio subterraneus TaxID=2718620 RepID=A0A7J0BJ37_9BACT|nr:hypothetical protein DSM101010T_16160 [Desulfovibrio subterraneus]